MHIERKKLIIFTGVGLLCLGFWGCSRQWQEYRSPDGKTRITISERFLFDEGINIDLTEGYRQRTLYQSPRTDWLPGFTEVLWSSDSRSAFVFTCNGFGGSYSPVALGFDLISGHTIDQAQVEKQLRDAIVRKYPVAGTSRRGPFRWACSQEGTDAYHGVNPDGTRVIDQGPRK